LHLRQMMIFFTIKPASSLRYPPLNSACICPLPLTFHVPNPFNPPWFGTQIKFGEVYTSFNCWLCNILHLLLVYIN
jgi:hypothetical protein